MNKQTCSLSVTVQTHNQQQRKTAKHEIHFCTLYIKYALTDNITPMQKVTSKIPAVHHAVEKSALARTLTLIYLFFNIIKLLLQLQPFNGLFSNLGKPVPER